jgi:hypothetical protein
MTAREMIRTHPVSSVREGIAECISACYDCGEICTICADACLAEPMVANLVHCIGTNQNCASISIATGAVLARQSVLDPDIARKQVQACLDVCEACALECERHGGNIEHCAVCAAACRRCAQACRNLLDQM